MRRLLALVFTVMLWFGFTANPAHALYDNLKPCKDVPAFMDRASTSQGGDVANRIDFYANKANLLCGEDGLPHLIIDNPAHAGEFIIPGVMFLYIAGWIGWVGRAYLIKVRASKNPEEQEIIINVPLAISCMLGGFAWPLAAFGEFSSGKLLAKEEEVTVSPR